MMNHLLKTALLAASFLVAPCARAHLMEAGQGTVRIVGDSAYAVVSIPVAALKGVDDNKDGLLDRAELNAHRASVSRQISAMLLFEDDGRPGRVLFEDLLLTHAGEPKARGEAHVVAMRRYQWELPVQALRMQVKLFDAKALSTTQLRLRALEGRRDEVVVFDRNKDQAVFFAAPAP